MKLEIKKEWSTYLLCDRFFVYLDNIPVNAYDSFEDAIDSLEGVKLKAMNKKEAEIVWIETF